MSTGLPVMLLTSLIEKSGMGARPYRSMSSDSPIGSKSKRWLGDRRNEPTRPHPFLSSKGSKNPPLQSQSRRRGTTGTAGPTETGGRSRAQSEGGAAAIAAARRNHPNKRRTADQPHQSLQEDVVEIDPEPDESSATTAAAAAVDTTARVVADCSPEARPTVAESRPVSLGGDSALLLSPTCLSERGSPATPEITAAENELRLLEQVQLAACLLQVDPAVSRTREALSFSQPSFVEMNREIFRRANAATHELEMSFELDIESESEYELDTIPSERSATASPSRWPVAGPAVSGATALEELVDDVVDLPHDGAPVPKVYGHEWTTNRCETPVSRPESADGDTSYDNDPPMMG